MLLKSSVACSKSIYKSAASAVIRKRKCLGPTSASPWSRRAHKLPFNVILCLELAGFPDQATTNKPKITIHNTKHQWCAAHHHQTLESFTLELNHTSLSSSPDRKPVWQMPGEHHLPESHLAEEGQWGCLLWLGLGPLVPPKGYVNAVENVIQVSTYFCSYSVVRKQAIRPLGSL